MDSQDTVLLSTAYFAPIHYFSKFLQFPSQIIERYDHYTKQTYRNRCNILGANGVLTLSIPVLKGSRHKTYVRDIRIDYSKNWQKFHWKGIESAYMHSPFFEFYLDEILQLLEKKHSFLLELNLEILDFLLDTLEIKADYKLSNDFIESTPELLYDFREIIHPKKKSEEDSHYHSEPYPQVFSDRFGFKENLSILDLIFNEGPNALTILEKSQKGLL